VEPIGLVALTVAVVAGAAIQGSLGFGLGLVAAPVAALVDTRFVPGPMLLAVVPLTMLVALTEREALDWRAIRWALVGRVPGTVVGVWAISHLPEREMAIVFSLGVLTAVGLSLAGWKLEPTDRTLFVAGATSGLMGTITSIGGPPMALVYQRHTGPQLRATLAAYFVVGSVLSVALLSAGGEMGGTELRLAALLLPGVLGGFAVSRLVARHLDRGRTRSAVLGFAALSATVLLVRELL
jgi:uncharacterized protein